ncbi:lytic polysaccharide monooxygenase auxiliary activity family 9 protein [Promicromonospora sp. NPDC023805]|uniref:lytic polysaccharide monooxygenase auxiliary activity family 9 protein n=1 Tax=Promicromonospora sp. NPDC023805 TaxID=3154696 RepID=UPI0033E70CC1
MRVTALRTPAARVLLGVFAALALTLTALVAAPSSMMPRAEAHGWVVSPPSRQDHCAKRTVSWSCNGVEWEPQSVEAPKGSMLCSGGSRFTTLDNGSLAWPRTGINSTHTFQWTLTAFHRTASWEYFVDGRHFKTVNDGGATPAPTVTHTLSGLPSGNHTILARWNVYDTAMAFYACMDVNVRSGSAGASTGSELLDGNGRLLATRL